MSGVTLLLYEDEQERRRGWRRRTSHMTGMGVKQWPSVLQRVKDLPTDLLASGEGALVGSAARAGRTAAGVVAQSAPCTEGWRRADRGDCRLQPSWWRHRSPSTLQQQQVRTMRARPRQCLRLPRTWQRPEGQS